MKRQRIMVIEDHKLLLQAIKDLLSGEGYAVTTAHNGAEALALMEEYAPDLIISDIMMPEMDGYTFYEKVRGNPKWTRIPFIFLTARGERNDIIKGKALGVEDYITKPFDTEELLIAIEARLKRANAIQQATEAEFEEIKQQIANVLSHELRTPLTYIAGYTELALEDISGLSPEELQSFLLRIKRGSDRLNHLVEDLLLSVQLDTGRTGQEYEAFAHREEQLNTLVERVVTGWQIQAQQQGVTLSVTLGDELPPVRLHEEMLSNALSRLIDNALKFSRGPEQRVEIRTEGAVEEVKIVISDNGVGMAEADVPKAFERFQQLNRAQMEQQGAGMGLYIANALVQLHGGEISVESEPGVGSTFTIHLPSA